MNRFDAIPVLLRLAARARLEGRREDEAALTTAIDTLWMGRPVDRDRLCRDVLLEKHVRRVAREMIADDVRSWREAPSEFHH